MFVHLVCLPACFFVRVFYGGESSKKLCQDGTFFAGCEGGGAY